MNKCILSGRLVREPELRYTSNGKAVSNFTLAVERRFNKDKTDFIKITAWGKQAENVCKYLDKGCRAIVSGELNIDKKEDKYYTSVNADEVKFIDFKSDKSEEEEVPNDIDEYEDDFDVPF